MELMESLTQMAQPNPEAQAQQQMQQQLAMQAAQSQIAVNTTQAERNRAEAINTTIETKLKPIEVQSKIMAANTQNLPDNDALASREFDKRVKIAELMLKEADIKNKSKIVEMQMAKTAEDNLKVDNDFLEELSKGLR